MMTDLITDLTRIEQLTEARRDEFEVLMYQLQHDDDLTDAQIDALVDEIAAPIVAAIDCTACGNCCRALTVHIYPEDIPRLAQGLDSAAEDIEAQYIDRPDDLPSDVWGQFKQQPCALLCGNLCSIYEHRPQACRDFPTFTPDFRWTLDYLMHNARICPIIYNVLARMVDAADELQRENP
jgi:uncharacterized protein